jgi:FixJ family two-component response regulator
MVTDVVMPAMGGRELAERLTALRPGVRVLFVSGYTGDAALPRGCHFLGKPFTQATLARKVREVLGG